MATTGDEQKRGEEIIGTVFKKGGSEKDCLSAADKYLKGNPTGIRREYLARACKSRTEAANAAAQRAKEDLKNAKAAKATAYKAAGKGSILSKVVGKAKGAAQAAGGAIAKAGGKVADKAKAVGTSVKNAGKGVVAGGKVAVQMVRKGAGSALIKAGQAVQPKGKLVAGPVTTKPIIKKR